MEDVQRFHARAVEAFGERVRAVPDDRWNGSTPCTDWDVRALVNHLVGENLWTPPLFEGKTIAEIGDVYDGDVLGADPKGVREMILLESHASWPDAIIVVGSLFAMGFMLWVLFGRR